MNKTMSAAEPNDQAWSGLRERLDYIERLSEERFSARDRALTVALAAMDRRLEGMNEFRDALRDQTIRFLSRDEYTTAHEVIVRNMELARLELSKYAVRVDELDKASSMDRAQLDKRLDLMNEFRAQLRDQTVSYITRPESDAVIGSISADLKRLEIASTTKLDKTDHEKLEVRIKDAENRLATWDGRLWALGTVFLLINIVVSWWLSGIHLSH
jgi:hypothetical protein